MDSLLQQASQIAVELLEAECCIIAWLGEDITTLKVRGSYGQNRESGMFDRNGGVMQIYAHPKGQSQMTLFDPDGAPSHHRFDEKKLTVPLRVNRQVVGYLYVLTGNKNGFHASGVDRVLFAAFSEQVGFAIEMQQMRKMLSSHYDSAAIGRSTKEDFPNQETLESQILAAVQNPEKVAKIVARSFYKDLCKAGFEAKQILVAAAEIIENLNEAFRKANAKM